MTAPYTGPLCQAPRHDGTDARCTCPPEHRDPTLDELLTPYPDPTEWWLPQPPPPDAWQPSLAEPGPERSPDWWNGCLAGFRIGLELATAQRSEVQRRRELELRREAGRWR